MRRVRAVAGGGLLVAAFVIACANGAVPTDLTPDTDSGYLDVARKEVEPVPPGDDGSNPPPPPPPPTDGGGDDGGGDGGGTGVVVINELQTTGSGGAAGDEFIELYNPGASSVSLSGWTLHHLAASGAGANTTLHTFTSTESVSPGGYFLLTSTSYSGTAGQATFTAGLASTGGQIGLVDGTTKLVDAVGYGGATGTYTEGTAAAAPDNGGSIARSPNGTDTNDNSKDFAKATPTPGAAN